MKQKYYHIIHQLMIAIAHLCSSPGSNVAISPLSQRWLITSTIFSCKMISTLMVTPNGSSLKYQTLARDIGSNSKYWMSIKSTISIKWEWRLSFILRDSPNRKIWAGTGEARTSNTMRTAIVRAASIISHFILYNGTMISFTTMMKYTSHIVIHIPSVISKTSSWKLKMRQFCEVSANDHRCAVQ